ncbi:DUF2891 domain-containing protein [Aliirhizobium terrae]|uniref:DUF2891 domain-containing protein n=1 Tax=Terrirhizobium terrae TaxID=2926709 RepID=UPI002578C02A|nr:DUF2891 domain-containing protein [Rhizobium sp. CC-CFT758]WJH42295.1 DUF2891 domain-containing protein [Rhizobium sp. CC-CFT758]
MAQSFATIALGHVRREYPNKPGNVLAGLEDPKTPSGLYPIFYGSFDWHSCVHGYWMLAHMLRRFPDLPAADQIRALFDTMLVPDKVAGECATMNAPMMRGFERPYGWGWLLKLAAELEDLEDGRWAEALRPLTEIFVHRFRDFLPIATYPVRVGTHFNTAFALRLAADYAETVGDSTFGELLQETALRWYGKDEACPAWGEPSGDDFLSSALIEAECMRRLMPETDFLPWFDAFLPEITRLKPATLFAPASVADRTDGKIAHLDGLNLSRAWCWRSLAKALSDSDPRRAIMEKAADEHLASGLAHVAGDYMGEHWLASFATVALEA